jgi:predicted nucleic acid-binding Zn ribbon protein
MPLEPLQQVLTDLKNRQWQQQQAFVHLLDAWSQIVGTVVAAQAQPIQITSGKVLLVATSSSAWAQNLAFERKHILNKLNTLVPDPFTDIRFSTSQWPSSTRLSRRPPVSQSSSSSTPASSQRSRATPLPRSRSDDPTLAFNRWSEAVRSQFQAYPHCPVCHCSTPPAELQRWSVCSLCAVRANQESQLSHFYIIKAQ